MGWWDTNDDGHLDAAERDRYLYDNGLMPGQPDGYWYDEDDEDSGPRETWPSDDEDDEDRNDDADDSGSSFIDTFSFLEDIEDDEAGVVRDENRCYNCLFWRDDYEDWTREYGCRIFYDYIEDACPGMDGTSKPDSDEETCEEFRPRLGEDVTCYNCKHWTGGPEGTADWGNTHILDLYCEIWDRVGDMAAVVIDRQPDGSMRKTGICPRFAMGKE